MGHLERLGLLEMLKRLAEGIVAVVGPCCEVVIHDFSDIEHSVVAIAGNVSGRRPGAPVPDLDFISEKLNRDTPDQLNYRIEINSRRLQSSTIWIRDQDGTPVGAVCVNVDFSGLLEARALVEKFAAPAMRTPDFVVHDTLARDPDELMKLSVASFLRRNGIADVESMTRKDKQQLITLIEQRGLFRIRGAAQLLAGILNVSRASIYNYRSRIRQEDSQAGSRCGEDENRNVR